MFQSVLDPIDRSSEVLFGVIMVMTFTGSLSVAQSGEEELRAMLVGAVSCNFAWGLVDATMYLMSAFMARARARQAFRTFLQIPDSGTTHRLLRAALPSIVSTVLTHDEIETIGQRLKQRPPANEIVRLTAADFLGAFGVFLLVFLSTFPMVLPFILMHETRPALRVSNAIAIAILFITGYLLGRYAGRSPWRVGFAMVVLGVALVALTMALGG
jgi:hypothetical protein